MEPSLLDSLFDVENVEDFEDVDMMDVEEGELVEINDKAESAQSRNVTGNVAAQEPQTTARKRRNKKRNKKRKGGGGGGGEADVKDINRFVLDTCRRLKEKKSYLVWTAVGCLGVPALNDLVKEVDAIQACGGQKTADGRRYKTGGGILWGILKTRDPNAFKEIMKKGKEFEKQFNKRPDLRNAPNQNKQIPSEAEGSHAAEVEPTVQIGDLHIEDKQPPKRPVHERIRVPVSYDDLVELEKPKDEAI
uniref:uncharacterized protein LOC122584683 n=1 Tax=Erigeron canadensis TaxID=72917 RepID=UPI001CB9AA5E|nr:uncharacterized protein LOC122584683 [Erigeron canadensis]XP_043612665.1 uncharacterized protein LOC122584683 [Erigeron canadensis]